MESVDKLREFVGHADGWGMMHSHVQTINEIADAIDQEHAELLDKALGEREESDGWVRLPVDADGVPIRIGDSIEIIGGVDGVAVAIELCENGGWNVGMRLPGWDTPTPFAAEYVRHHHAPTVEDVLRGFTDAILEWAGKSGTVAEVGTWSDVAAEYAAKLRLAGDAE